MNLTYFRPKLGGSVENKNINPVNIRFVRKTSDIYLRTSHVMSCWYIRSGKTRVARYFS